MKLKAPIPLKDWDLPFPEGSDWQMQFCGKSFVIRPYKGDEPNWFHRWMQRLCFGFVWRKVC